ncbi:MAG: hypothetical protein JRJ62_16075 [Deltaproteobacteria bacterium]|nr:hypothetical protein [Deltaproteobacteria bacterium]
MGRIGVSNQRFGGWGTNIVALSDGKAYAFWQYDIDSNVRLYFNEYDNG